MSIFSQQLEEMRLRINSVMELAGELADKHELPRLLTFLAALPIALLIAVVTPISALFLWTTKNIVGSIVLSLIKGLDETKKELVPVANDFTAAALGEMMGVEFSASDLPTAGDPAANQERARRVGDKIITLLEQEFAPDGVINPAQGERAAKMFAGFNVNFAASNAVISMVSEALSFGVFDTPRELGTQIAQNLGLGRMSRHGLTELVGTAVATPYEWHVNKKYRPTRPGATQLVEAFFKGKLNEGELKEFLAQAGFSDQFIDILIANAQKVLGDAELSRLIRHGFTDTPNSLDELRAAGWSDERANAVLKTNALARVDARIEEYINRIQTLAVAGRITLNEYKIAIDDLPLFPEEKRWLKDSIAEIFEHPRKEVSLSQVEDFLIEGLWTAADVRDWIVREGYSADEADTLFELIAIRAQRELTKRAEAAAKKIRPDIPALTLSQLRAAFIDTILTLTEFETRVLALGYSPEDAQVIILQAVFDRALEDERRRAREERERRRREDEADKAGEPPTP